MGGRERKRMRERSGKSLPEKELTKKGPSMTWVGNARGCYLPMGIERERTERCGHRKGGSGEEKCNRKERKKEKAKKGKMSSECQSPTLD